MPLVVTCPNCRQSLAVPDHGIGKSVRCPRCQNVFVAQAPAAPPAPCPQPPGVIHPVVLPPSPVARGSSPPLPPPSPVSAGPVGAPYPGMAVPGVARQVEDFKPLEFGVTVKADPDKQLKGIWQARLSKDGLRLRQRKKEDLLFPVGTRVALVKGNII